MTAVGRLALPQAASVLDAVAARTWGMPVRAAMAPVYLRDYLPLLAAHGWGIDTVERGPDAADLVLLQRGGDFVAAGCTDLYVISGDHVFADLADLARLHVISLPGRLSRRLRRRATSVTLLNAPSLRLAA